MTPERLALFLGHKHVRGSRVAKSFPSTLGCTQPEVLASRSLASGCLGAAAFARPTRERLCPLGKPRTTAPHFLYQQLRNAPEPPSRACRFLSTRLIPQGTFSLCTRTASASERRARGCSGTTFPRSLTGGPRSPTQTLRRGHARGLSPSCSHLAPSLRSPHPL